MTNIFLGSGSYVDTAIYAHNIRMFQANMDHRAGKDTDDGVARSCWENGLNDLKSVDSNGLRYVTCRIKTPSDL